MLTHEQWERICAILAAYDHRTIAYRTNAYHLVCKYGLEYANDLVVADFLATKYGVPRHGPVRPRSGRE
jgi:hypothetical protein